MNQYLVRVVVVLVCWRFSWLLIYWATGVYVGYLSINNGVSVNNVKFKRKVHISASSVRLRLWGNTRKLVISDLNVTLQSHTSEKKHKSKRQIWDSPLSLYPSSALSQLLVKSVLRLLRTVDIEFRDTKIGHQAFSADAKSLSVLLKTSISPATTDVYDIKVIFSTLQAHARLHSSAGTTDLLRVGSSTVSFGLSVNRQSGLLSNMATRVYVDESELNVFHVIRKMVVSPEKCPDKPAKGESQSLDSRIENFTKMYNKFSPCFKECSINIAHFCCRGIPLIPASPDGSLSDYFNSTAIDTLYASVDTASIHFERLLPRSAGYEIHFNSAHDLPIHVTFSSSLVKAGFEANAGGDIGLCFGTPRSEFLSLPNLSFTFKTNAARHLIRGLGFKNCVFEFFASGSSPLLDLDHHQLAKLAFHYTVLRKMLTLRKLDKANRSGQASTKAHTPMSSESDDGSGDETRVAQEDPMGGMLNKNKTESKESPLFDKAMALLKEYYPHVDVKLTFEQPRVLIRVHQPSEDKLKMLMLSYSLMVLHVSTTEDKDYEAECRFIHPNVTFSEKASKDSFSEVFHEEICGLADVKLSLRMYKDLKLKTKIRFNGAYVNLSKPDVLNGLHDIISETTSSISHNSKVGLINAQCDEKILKAREGYQTPPLESGSSESPFFRALPSWFVSFEVRFEDIQVLLGSASPLLPPNYISGLSDLDKQRFVETESTIQLQIAALVVNIDDANGSPSYASSVASSASSSETLAGDSAVIHWAVLAQLDNLKMTFSNESKQSSILTIPSFNQKLTSITEHSSNKLVPETDIRTISVNLDRHKLFAAFGSAYLISQTIVTPMKQLHQRLRKNVETLNPISKPAGTKHLLDCLSAGVKVEKFDVVLALSNDFKVRLQNYNLQAGYSGGIITVLNRFARAMVVSSTLAHHWDRMLCVDSLRMNIGDPSQDQLITLETKSIRIIQPDGLIMYKLFDNLAVFVKIAKHLASCFKCEEKVTRVSPKESKPVISPGIKLNTTSLTFTIEDDPFDSELNMIYQLGLVEQRKRLEHLSLFEQQYKQSPTGSCQNELESLHKYFERSWVRKVRVYKEELRREISENKQYLFGSEANVPEHEYDRIKPYSLHAPLLSMMLEGVDLDLLKPKFSLSGLADFIHEHGQGVPKDTRYNLMIPAYMDLNVEEVRMHLRDYPLPLLHLPYAKNEKGVGGALNMRGHLIICESLILEKQHLRELKVQLTSATAKPSLQPNAFDKLIIEKSLSTVKIYTDMSVKFDSDSPSRFVWGQSYQFGIQQIMLTVDQFSKAPVDPSPKVGFWDKMRLIMHGNLSIETGQFASLEVAFKGGKDPYDLFGESNGFILSFKDSVVWKVNPHDDSLRFFEVSAEKLAWYIPNYLANPLICWTRESSNPTYLPGNKDFVSSCHGYYLGTKTSSETVDTEWCEKKVVEMSGGVEFTVGFLLQRFAESKEKLTSSSKPHYEVELYNPEFTEEDHDSYLGFRSDRLHMAISLKAHTKDSYNTIHLSHGVFKQFFSWWTMFQGNTMLPIRKGKLFQEIKSSQKFSEHLFTNKFLFDVGNLFIGHIFKKEDSDETSDEYDCVGLRAKVSEFLVDLHQRKEEVVDVHEDLSRHKRIMKMKFNLGQVLLNKIDLRTVEARFHRDIYNQGKRNPSKPPKNFLKIFDSDQEWFDMRDYEECFCPFTGDVKSARIHPFLYSETFAYVRDTTADQGQKEFIEEKMHKCILENTEYKPSEIELYRRRIEDLQKLQQNCPDSPSIAERIEVLSKMIKTCEYERGDHGRKGSIMSLGPEKKENFHNRFLLVSMFLKWNEPVRNQFMSYIHFVKVNSIHKKFLSFEFMSFLEAIIEKQDNFNDGSSLGSSLSEMASQRRALAAADKLQSSQQRFDDFDKIIRRVDGLEKAIEDFKIEIISPQIQLHTEELKDSVVIITAPVLESKILSVVINKDAQNQSNPKVLEKRYGVVLHNANVMVIDEEDVKKKRVAFERTPYGTKSKWPPFLGIETCKNHELASRDNVLVEQMSLMLMYNQVIASSSNIEQMEGSGDSETFDNNSDPEHGADKLRVDVPRIAINCTSKQYFTLYATILSLLLYVEPMAAKLQEKISKINFSINFQDFRALRDRLMSLYDYLGITNQLLKNYNFRQNGHLDNEDLNDYLLLTNKKATLETEIVLMQQTFFSGDILTDSLSRVIQDWRIAADKIMLHMLNDDRSHILDLSIDRGVYKRTVKDDGSNDNRIEIKSIDGYTRLPNSTFETFLEPLKTPQKANLITVDWSMNRSIGGIKIIDNFDISSLPLNVRIDEETGRSLMKFIFRQDEDDALKESPVLKIADRAQKNKDDDDSDDDEQAEKKSEVRSRRGSEAKSSSKESSLATSSRMDLDQDVNIMISRAKKYLSIAKMTSQSFELMISLRMKTGVMKWLNVTNFSLVLPQWHIERKILSLLEVVEYFKTVLIKALVGHSGSLLKNKVTARSKNVTRYKKRLELMSTGSRPSQKTVTSDDVKDVEELVHQIK